MPHSEFGPAVYEWLQGEPAIRSAVLFGSVANRNIRDQGLGFPSDIDLHIISSNARQLENTDWTVAIPTQTYLHQAVRSATGGVRKTTVLFNGAQLDLVIVPLSRMWVARSAFFFGLQRKSRALEVALNEMATCLKNGYIFIKGEHQWGGFYSSIKSRMPGVRLDDQQIKHLAACFLCDLMWITQKIDSGELSAAQHLLHRSLAETNFKLVRELRLRCGLPLPSFGLGRKVEVLLPTEQLRSVQIDSGLEAKHLRQATWKAFDGLQRLMAELVPSWRTSTDMGRALDTLRNSCA